MLPYAATSRPYVVSSGAGIHAQHQRGGYHRAFREAAARRRKEILHEVPIEAQRSTATVREPVRSLPIDRRAPAEQ